MNPQVKAQWLEALRGGEYQQGKGTLRRSNGTFCCLGVLCDLHRQAHSGEWTPPIGGSDWWRYFGCGADLPLDVMQWAGLPSRNPKVLDQHAQYAMLSDLNDGANGNKPLTFAQIADLIEAQDGGVA